MLLQLVAASAFALVVLVLVGRPPRAGGSVVRNTVTALLILVAVAVTTPELWPHVIDRYPGDSHHTLPGYSGVLVFVIALVFAIAGVVIARWMAGRLWRATRGMMFWILTPLSILLTFGLATLIAPQVFYTVYLAVFEGLPLQWVIEPGQAMQRLTNSLVWRPGQSMSADGAAIALHAMGLAGLAEGLRRQQAGMWAALSALFIARLILNLPSWIAF